MMKQQTYFDELIEPIIWIDTVIKKIVYSNKVCESLCTDHEELELSELRNIIVSAQSYGEVRKKVIEMEHEVIIPDVKMYTYGEGIIRGDLQIMHVNKEKTCVQIQFRYNKADIKGVFLKSRCFEAIYKNSYSYPFLLDVKNRMISFIGSVQDDFSVQSIVKNFPQEIIESGVIYKDDIEQYKKVVEKMYLGENTTEVFRSYTTDEKLLWYQVRCVGYRDYNGELVEVIGEFVNVQEKKELELKLYTDALTGCLNKSIFQDLVMKQLANCQDGEEYALLIIDLDDFKRINDNLGHPFGDIVLRETGEHLRRIFHDTEYVGRIGGDEFAVFTKVTKYRKRLISAIEEAVRTFDNTYKGNTRKYRMTSSIGVSLYPKDGTDFASLYSSADVALYETKYMGKNGYTFYDYKMETGNMNNTTPFDVANRALSQHFDQQIIFEVFALMTEAKDYEASINKVLQLLGVRFNAERCYIFEANKEYEGYVNNTYEWCADGVTEEIKSLQMLPVELYQPLLDLTNEEGILYCNDLEILKGKPVYETLKNQGIVSFLLSFNKVGDKLSTIIGFDDCTSHRKWSPIEISTMMYAGKIVNQFLT